jgi:hypothetical protein
MRTSHEKTIDEVTITIRQLPAMKSMKFFREVVGCFGPSLMSIAGDSTEEDAISGAIEQLMMNLTDDKLQKMVDTLFLDALVELDGKPRNLVGHNGVFDLVFQGKVFTIFKFLWFALEVNYEDFFEGSTGIKAQLESLTSTSPSESQKK